MCFCSIDVKELKFTKENMTDYKNINRISIEEMKTLY